MISVTFIHYRWAISCRILSMAIDSISLNYQSSIFFTKCIRYSYTNIKSDKAISRIFVFCTIICVSIMSLTYNLRATYFIDFNSKVIFRCTGLYFKQVNNIIFFKEEYMVKSGNRLYLKTTTFKDFILL